MIELIHDIKIPYEIRNRYDKNYKKLNVYDIGNIINDSYF